jgi:hypothetical protein
MTSSTLAQTFLDPILLQHFYIGLSKKFRVSLDAASGGAFLDLSISQARAILDTISSLHSLVESLRKRRSYLVNKKIKFW